MQNAPTRRAILAGLAAAPVATAVDPVLAALAERERLEALHIAAINKNAQRLRTNEGVSRRIEEILSQAAEPEVSPEVSAARENETIEAAAARGVEVVRQHRKDISGYSAMARRLLGELEESTIHNEEIADLIEQEARS